MENDSQDFQTLHSDLCLDVESITEGRGVRQEEKKRKKGEVMLHNLRKSISLFICFLECSEHLVLLATRNHFCCAKGFTHELKPKSFFKAQWEGKKNTV